MTEEMVRGQMAIKYLTEGKFVEAIKTAEELRDKSLKAAIFIDAGFELEKSGTIRKGVEFLEGLLSNPEELKAKKFLAETFYNLANGYSSIFQLREKRRSLVKPANDTDLRRAKKYFREAIRTLSTENKAKLTELNINYANCLSQFGRKIEAVAIYKEALEIEPFHPMALGNLGLELSYLGYVLPSFNEDYFISSGEYLYHAVEVEQTSSQLHDSAKLAFEQRLGVVRKTIAGFGELKESSISFSSRLFRSLNRKFLNFCADKNLFLNAWVGDFEAVQAIIDSINFGPITMSVRDQKTVPEMLRILNDAKETYTTARYLFFCSQRKSRVVTDISKLTTYFQSEEQELNSLHMGLCKSAYLRAFDVLDKVARIVNVYFGIGKRRGSFWEVFVQKHSAGESKLKSSVARPEVVNLDNAGLYALADLCIDYFESERTDFKKIDERRNLLTHDHLVVEDNHGINSNREKTISEEELFEQTEKVLLLAKNSLLYLIMAVSISEQKKDKSKALPREYQHYHGV